MSCDSKQFDNHPAELRQDRNWVVWVDDTKRPRQAHDPTVPASKTNPDHMSTYGESVRCVESGCAKGIGRSNFGGTLDLDLDTCLVDDKPAKWALDLIEGLPPTYVERTPSQKGLRVSWLINPADTPPKSTKAHFASHMGAEVLVKGSYVTVTGDVWGKRLPVARLSKSEAELLVSRVQALKKPRVNEDQPATNKIPSGKRHDALNNFAFKMRKQGYNLPIIEAATIQYDRDAMEVPKGEKYVREKIIPGIKTVCEQSKRSPATVTNGFDFTEKEFMETEILLAVKTSGKEVIHHPSAGEIHAYRGTGKTNVAIGLLNCIATAGDFLAYHCPKARKVLYVDGEMAGSDLQKILVDLTELSPNFHVLAIEEQIDHIIPSIAVQEGLDWVEEAITRIGAEVVCLDSWSTLGRVGTNEEEAWLVFMAWVSRMRLRGITIFYLQHDGKTGKQRGHSRPEDLLNWVIQLKWETGYTGSEGLRCLMLFDKSRRPIYECSKLKVSLAVDKDESTWVWSVPGGGEQVQKKKAGRKAQQPDAAQLQWLKSFSTKPPVKDVQEHLKVSYRVAKRWIEDYVGKCEQVEVEAQETPQGDFITDVLFEETNHD